MIDFKNIPIGIYEKALPLNLNWKKRLEIVYKAEYDFLEISIDESDERISRLNWSRKEKDELIKTILLTGVPIKTMCLSGHRKYPIGSEDEKTRKIGMEMMKKAIQFSSDIGIRIIQLAGYDVYYESSNEQTKRNFIEGLKKSVECASCAGVVLAIETMDTEFVNSITKAMEYIEQINSPWLQIYPDIGNLSAWNLDIKAELERGKGHIVAVHIKDTVPGKFRKIPFGEGTVDFVSSFKQLAKLNYQGPMVIEMWGGNNIEEYFENIVKAKKWLEKKIKEAWIGKIN